jgi:hypothetical protein
LRFFIAEFLINEVIAAHSASGIPIFAVALGASLLLYSQQSLLENIQCLLFWAQSNTGFFRVKNRAALNAADRVR